VSNSTSVGPHLFWFLSRGSGTAALVLSSISACVGLTIGGRITTGEVADRRAYHETLSLAVLVLIGVHGLTLVGDPFMHPSLADVAVPFAWSYMRLATTLGIVAGWALIALGLSFYYRDRIGRARWKVLHRLTLLAWLGGLVHTILEGTDAGTAWYIVLLVVSTAPVVVLAAIRILTVPEEPPRPTAPIPLSPAPSLDGPGEPDGASLLF
jgi:methionine sulfoxide reductase heme-binding subunit